MQEIRETKGIDWSEDHIAPGMRRTLMAALTEMWAEALDARRAMSPGAPMVALDALLKARQ
ncbi:hypothetical protein ABZ922_03755 [Streptomyces shenzhenensis]|uniref:hypothetical protein n=1 Tax=Streptomyces shenzhenensis TaxID=943815 RepID=UPI0033C423BD